jgi:hypothetical protein
LPERLLDLAIDQTLRQTDIAKLVLAQARELSALDATIMPDAERFKDAGEHTWTIRAMMMIRR